MIFWRNVLLILFDTYTKQQRCHALFFTQSFWHCTSFSDRHVSEALLPMINFRQKNTQV